MLSKTHHHHNSMEQSNNSKHHQPSPAMVIHNNANQHLSNNYHQTHILPPLPSLSLQCSAYFITRHDLNDYTVYTLKQTVDSVVSGPKSKGLKVKLSLPDEGLVIDNIPDPSQSWMYKTSELLYFWRDPYYANIIVIITFNRSRYLATGPYSASIFRLRGNESVQLFLQRAQQFFAQLSAPNTSTHNTKVLLEKSATAENLISDDQKKKSKHHSKTNKPSVPKPFSSPQLKPARRVIRTEFNPQNITPVITDSISQLYNHRTYSETTVSSDTRTTNSKKINNNYDEDDDDDDKITTVSNHLSGGYVTELMHELKELRKEIAALKLDTRFTPMRSASTSPLLLPEENTKQRMSLSPSFPKLTALLETDAETQTDFSLNNDEQQYNLVQNKTIMDTSNEISVRQKRKNEQSNTNVNKRTFSNVSNNIESDREETTLINSSQMNGSSNATPSSSTPPNSFLERPRSILKTYQNGSTVSNNNQSISNFNSFEKDSSLRMIPVKNEKETAKLYSTNNSSSIPMDTGPSLPIKIEEVVSFHSSLEDTIAPPENIYENVPISIQMNSKQGSYIVNENDKQQAKPYLHVTIAGDRDSEFQQQYLSQLFGPQNGISLLLPQQSIPNNLNPSFTTQQTTLYNYPYSQQVLFSDHLTNPLFNVDKQLLANTIANQFGMDLKSPDLKKLITHQHLFVAHKRTFANMIWQITPEEEYALCSSPPTRSTFINIKIVDSNSSTAKSILKSTNSPRLLSKRQHVSWDSALE